MYRPNFVLMIILLTMHAPAAWSQLGNSGSANTNAVQALQEIVLQADQAYENQDFNKAFKLYQRLAKDAGDEFSQYRLAVMHYLGQHVERDVVSAYAWSALAAESGIKQYSQFNRKIASALKHEQLEAGTSMAQDLIQQYGIFQQAWKTRKLLRQEKFSCTGSRVGNTCASVSTQDFSCSIAAERAPSERCLRIGRMGLSAVAGAFPLEVKKAEQALEALMDRYNPGKVTMGELELLEDHEDHQTQE